MTYTERWRRADTVDWLMSLDIDSADCDLPPMVDWSPKRTETQAVRRAGCLIATAVASIEPGRFKIINWLKQRRLTAELTERELQWILRGSGVRAAFPQECFEAYKALSWALGDDRLQDPLRREGLAIDEGELKRAAQLTRSARFRSHDAIVSALDRAACLVQAVERDSSAAARARLVRVVSARERAFRWLFTEEPWDDGG